MRYGVYQCKETKCTTYWAFSSDICEEAEKRGFMKVKETEMEMEAIQEARRLNALIANQKGRH
ncbi:hypothetical protein ACKX2D_05105 [Lachnospiraceae bacterium YH-ros2226]